MNCADTPWRGPGRAEHGRPGVSGNTVPVLLAELASSSATAPVQLALHADVVPYPHGRVVPYSHCAAQTPACLLYLRYSMLLAAHRVVFAAARVRGPEHRIAARAALAGHRPHADAVHAALAPALRVPLGGRVVDLVAERAQRLNRRGLAVYAN